MPTLPLFAKRDLDGFFGLFIDNLVQLLLIVVLCDALCGIAPNSPLLTQYILPGAAVSILLGNIFYAWQAHRLARRENRNDVTALPYGINTPSLLVFILFVMRPAYQQALNTHTPEQAAEIAWKMGLVACVGSGLIEFSGVFFAEWVRKRTPRAALLSTLAGIAIGFISMKFALEIYDRPLVAMLPLAIILVSYVSGVGFPLGLPGGFVGVALGTACAWVLPFFFPTLAQPAMSVQAVADAWKQTAWSPPRFAGELFWPILKQPDQWIGYMSVILPMGLFNLIGSLQNIESAEAAGDRYNTPSSLAANGLGTMAAACFGSCFPTTIYIGHPGWKALGARAGYSTLNGLVITAICLTGTVGLISSIVPIQAGMAIVLWIGIIITAQAFQATPNAHAPAVAIGLFPAIAAWGATVASGTYLQAGGLSMQQALEQTPHVEVSGFLLHGMLTLERGYIFTCMILSAVVAFLVDRKFYAAALWSGIAALFAAVGLTHAYQLTGNDLDFFFAFTTPRPDALTFRATGIAIGYVLFATLFAAFGWYTARSTKADQLQE